MAITQRQVGIGVGGASLGVVSAELAQHGIERGAITDAQGTALAAASGVGTLGIGAATLAGIGPLAADTGAFLSGYGVGALSWYAGRETGLAPRLAFDVPESVNVAEPVIAGLAFTAVTTAVATAASLARNGDVQVRPGSRF